MRIEEIRTDICARLRTRQGEIEQAVLTRVSGISEPAETSDPEYADGLRAAVSAEIGYGIDALERDEEHSPPIPTALLAQARLAARRRVSLDTVLRRYLAGYTLLGDFVIDESEHGGASSGASLKRLMRAQAVLFERLVAVLSEEYHREAVQPGSKEQRRVERVQRLLDGEMLDTSEFAYHFGGWHLGVVAVGANGAAELKGLAAALDCNLLLVRPGEEMVWAWLGTRRQVSVSDLQERMSASVQGACLAFGEAGEEVAGWRLTHLQARAALSVAQRSGEAVVRYADVGLLASIIQDDVLTASLRQLYVEPLLRIAGGGSDLRTTLRAYLASGRNVSSAAAALRVDRRTVTRRIRVIEDTLGRSVRSSAAEIETALRLWDIDELPRGRSGYSSGSGTVATR